MEFAQQIYQTHTIGGAIWWPPLYALFLSVFVSAQNPFIIISLLQAVGYLFTLLLLREIVIKIGAVIPIIFELAALVLLIAMPSFFLIGRVPLAETIFLLFYMSHGYSLIQFFVKKRSVWLGLSILFLILATFTKPTTILLHLVEYPLLFVWLNQNKIQIKQQWMLLFFAILIPSFVYGLWIWRNYKYTGVYVFANVANYNLLAQNYFHLLPYIGALNSKPGDELRIEKSEAIRKRLFQEELPHYIREHTHQRPEALSQTQTYAFASQMAIAQIIKHLPVYILIHYLKSLALFIPDNWETVRHIYPQAKTPIISADLFIGVILFGLFIKSITVFIKNLRAQSRYNIKSAISLLAFINIFYLFSIIGPAALDDGGRFSFVVYPWLVLVFITTLSLNTRNTF